MGGKFNNNAIMHALMARCFGSDGIRGALFSLWNDGTTLG